MMAQITLRKFEVCFIDGHDLRYHCFPCLANTPEAAKEMMLDRYGRNFDHSIIAVLDKGEDMTKNNMCDIISANESGGDRGVKRTDQVKRLQRMQEQGKEISRVTELRMSAGLSQTELAEAIGVTQAYIAMLEKGKIDVHNIALKKGVQIAKALGVTAEDLLS